MNEEIVNKSYYAILPANVRYDERLKDKAKLLYAEITGLSNEKGFCWATNAYFASHFHTSKGNVSKLLSQLKEYGYIHIELIRNKDTKQVEKRLITLLSNATIGIIKKDIDPIVKNDTKEYYKYVNNIKEYFNGKSCFSKIIKLTDKREKKLICRLKEIGYDDFIKAIDLASTSDFLTGKNDRNWKMDFDWLIDNDTNIIKVLEGKYTSKNEFKEKTQGRTYGPIIN